MSSQENIWSQCLKHLKTSLPHSDFIEYIQPLKPSWSGNDLILWAPNVYVVERAAHFSLEITHALADIGVDYTIHFQKSNATFSDAAAAYHHPATPQLADNPPHKFSVHADKTFQRFIVGECNRHAVEVAQNVVRQALNQNSLDAGAAHTNLVILWGGVGAGKTHLLHAIHNELKAKSVLGVGYVQAESFKRDVVQGIQNKTIQSLMQRLASLRLLLVDDLHWLVGAEKCQMEMLCLLERLVFEQGAQMVISCGRHPGEIVKLERRLADRLEGGLAVPLSPHTTQVRLGLLMQQAVDGGRSISPEVAAQAAARMSDKETGRSITGVMKQLCLVATNKPIHLPEIDNALRRRRETCRVSVERILQVTAEHYETRPGVLVGKKRTRSAVNARHVGMYLCKTMTVASYSEIAATFGNRHHTAVMHACRKISKQIQSDVELAQDTQDIKRLLGRGKIAPS